MKNVKHKKGSRKERKAQRLAELKALQQTKLNAAKVETAMLADHEQRLLVLEQRVIERGAKGDKGDPGEKGKGFWG